MANVKISALTAATTPLAGTEVLPIVQSGVTVNVAVSNLTAGRSVSSTAIAITGSTSGTATIVTPAVAGTPTLTLPITTDTLVGKATTDTLTNKTLTAPVIATIVNTGTLTLPTSTDTLVGRATTDTLTNKTLVSPTITGNLNLPNTFGFKNRAINGDVRIDQTNQGAAITVNAPSSFFSADMFVAVGASAAGVFTVQQLSATPPTGFKNYLRTTVTTADATPAAGSVYVLTNRIEGLNVIDFSLGTANAIAFTVSFYVRSSLTGAFSGSLTNGAFDRSFPFSFTINAANTWEQKTVSLTGDLSGTWATGNTLGLLLLLDLGNGANARSTALTWQAGGFYGVTGAVRLISTVSSTFDITGVQIETGSSATAFDYRDYESELARCQRYLPAFNSTSTASALPNYGQATTTTNVRSVFKFPVSTRVYPTGISVSSGSHFTFQTNATNYASSAAAIVGLTGGVDNGVVDFTVAVTVLSAPGFVYFNNASGYILFTGARL